MPTTPPMQTTTPSSGVVYVGPSLSRSLLGMLAAIATGPENARPPADDDASGV